MIRNTLAVASLFALAPLIACTTPPPGRPTDQAPAAQGDAASPRTKGSIFRSDIDRLIAAIAARTQEQGRAAPYATSLLEAAQIVTAMGHCHRFYVAADNPRIRATIASLLHGRRDDGSFGETAALAPTTTAWVIDALSVLDADHYRDEIATAKAWLERQPPTKSWAASVQAMLDAVRGDVYPEHLAKPQKKFAGNADAKTLDVSAATAALVHLTACQAANRELDAPTSLPDPAPVTFATAQQRAFAFLLSQQQDGVFSATYNGKSFPDPAFTGFGLLALQTKPAAQRTATEQTLIDHGIQWLLAGQNDDGSFGQQLQNYTTSVVVGALARCGNPAAPAAMAKAQQYILKCQNVEGTGYQSGDRDYGSIGYGGSQRGDLSNVHFALQALRESGLPAEDEAFQKALVFLQRSQNLKSVNDFAGKVSNPDDNGKLIDITSGDDGGGIYYPGNSAAGYLVNPDGKSIPRSYGSMTYALLKSYTLCGVKGNDPRLQKVVEWIASHWSLERNPGFDAPPADKAHYAGLFYYYMVLAQALDLAGVDKVTTLAADGTTKTLDWRPDLRAHLTGLQQADGSWVNAKNQRWMEGVDVLCTCYAMLALEHCR